MSEEKKIKKKKSQGSRNRNSGHNLERRLANKFKELGYTFCKTSRQASRLLDDSKVDLAFIPYNVQAKKGYLKGLNYTAIFDQVNIALKENFPPDDAVHNNPTVIIHDKGRKKQDKLVVIQEDDFFEMVRKIKENEV